MTSHTPNEIALQFSFDNPDRVSIGYEDDVLSLKVMRPYLLVSESGEPLSRYTSEVKTAVPPILVDIELIKQVLS